MLCRRRVTTHLKQDCAAGCNWRRWGNEKSEIESNSSPLGGCDVGLSPRLRHHRQTLCLLLALCHLFRSPSTCRNVSIWTSPPHLLTFASPCCISHLTICPSRGSAMYEKVPACWPRPQEVSFPLKHNYPTAKTRPSHWWPRNTSKWHGKLKKDCTEFMNFNSNPNSHSSSYSYLQAIFGPFSLRSAGPALLSWRVDEKKVTGKFWFMIAGGFSL